jgi:hypothetical protein
MISLRSMICAALAWLAGLATYATDARAASLDTRTGYSTVAEFFALSASDRQGFLETLSVFIQPAEGSYKGRYQGRYTGEFLDRCITEKRTELGALITDPAPPKERP